MLNGDHTTSGGEEKQSDAALGARPAATLAIGRGASRLLVSLGWAVLPEVTLATGRRLDLMAIDGAGRILAVEVKSGLADFAADRKWPEYLDYCDALAFAVGPEFPPELIQPEIGLILADAFEAIIARPWIERALSAARRKHLLIRFGALAAGRLNRLIDPGI